MAIPMYGQNNDGNALNSVALSRGYLKITAGVTLTGVEGGIIHIADTDACAIVLPTITAEENTSSGHFRLRFTNVTSGSETFSCYRLA